MLFYNIIMALNNIINKNCEQIPWANIHVNNLDICGELNGNNIDNLAYSITSIGNGVPVLGNTIGNYEIKSLNAGTNISLNDNSGTITINSTGGGGSGTITGVSNDTGTYGLVESSPVTSGNVIIKGINAGSGVSINDNGNTLTINSTGSGGGTITEISSIPSAAGFSLVQGDPVTSGVANILKISAGDYMQITALGSPLASYLQLTSLLHPRDSFRITNSDSHTFNTGSAAYTIQFNVSSLTGYNYLYNNNNSFTLSTTQQAINNTGYYNLSINGYSLTFEPPVGLPSGSTYYFVELSLYAGAVNPSNLITTIPVLYFFNSAISLSIAINYSLNLHLTNVNYISLVINAGNTGILTIAPGLISMSMTQIL